MNPDQTLELIGAVKALTHQLMLSGMGLTLAVWFGLCLVAFTRK